MNKFDASQFAIHIAGVHKNGDDTEVEASDHRLEAGQVSVLGQLANEPVAGQHTDDVTHADHTRGESHYNVYVNNDCFCWRQKQGSV